MRRFTQQDDEFVPKTFLDDDGKKVKLQTVSDDGSWSIQCLSPGIYAITIGYKMTRLCNVVDCKCKGNIYYKESRPKKCGYKELKKYHKQHGIIMREGCDITTYGNEYDGYQMALDILMLKKLNIDEIITTVPVISGNIEVNGITLHISYDTYFQIHSDSDSYYMVIKYQDCRFCDEECKYCTAKREHKTTIKKPKKCKFTTYKIYVYDMDCISETHGLRIYNNPLFISVLVLKKMPN